MMFCQYVEELFFFAKQFEFDLTTATAGCLIAARRLLYLHVNNKENNTAVSHFSFALSL
jgi:hypothetical protein